MATIPMNVPLKAGIPAAQAAGTPVESWLSAGDAVLVLTGAGGGAYALQAEKFFDFGSPGVGGGNPWVAVGPQMTAAGSYTLPGVRSGSLRLTLQSGDASGVKANLTTN